MTNRRSAHSPCAWAKPGGTSRMRWASLGHRSCSTAMVPLSRIDLNLFVVFEAIYAERGVTRAGERLNVTQPAISHSLARLRELVGEIR